MRTDRAVRAALCSLLLFGFSSSSHAQNVTRTELSAGWRLLHEPRVNSGQSETFPLGWYADIAGNLTGAVGVVGEVSGHYKSWSPPITQGSVEVTFRRHTFLGGVRFSARRAPRFTPFAQALFGFVHGSAKIETQTVSGSRTISDTQSGSGSDFAFDASGGVNLNIRDAFGIRVATGYLRIGDGDGRNAFRFGAGVVVPF